VSITERITAKAFAPSVDRNSPETFCLTLKVLTALSEALLSGGIFSRIKTEGDIFGIAPSVHGKPSTFHIQSQLPMQAIFRVGVQ
jgi:hypothetical protein